MLEEKIRKYLTYNPEDGKVYWKVSRGQAKAGKEAGYLHPRGYRVIWCHRPLKTHRIAWFLQYGYWPNELDHIDRNRLNNKIENLREVTRSQNNMNKSTRKNSSSKYKGVSWDKSRNLWQVHIRINYKGLNLGRFTDEKEAALAYNIAAEKYFGEYAVLNKIE